MSEHVQTIRREGGMAHGEPVRWRAECTCGWRHGQSGYDKSLAQRQALDHGKQAHK